MDHNGNTEKRPDAKEIAGRYQNAVQRGSGWRIPCPGHHGEDANCYIANGDDGGLVAKCWSHGCSWQSIMEALGLPARGMGSSYIASYQNADGKDRHVYRKDNPKTGSKRISGKGGATGCLLLPWGDDSPDKTLVIVEGEKAAAAMSAAAVKGYTAVSWRGGTNSVGKANYGLCRDRDVILWPDNDPPGQAAMNIAGGKAAKAGAKIVRLLDVADLPTKGDAADLNAAAIGERLGRFVTDWQPADPPAGELKRSTLIQKMVEREETIAIAVQDVLQSGKYLSLGDDWWGWLGKFWRRVFTYNVTDALTDAAYRKVGFVLCGADQGEALKRLSQASRYQLGGLSSVTPEDMTQNFRLDTGEVIEGAIFDDDIVTVNALGIQRRKVTRLDFVRGGRGYALPDMNKLKDVPLFRQYLATSLGGNSADAVRLLVEYLGRVLLGYMDDQKFLVLLGPGGSGKGTFVRLVEMLVGKDMSMAVSQPQELGQRFQTSKLVGRSLLTIGDIAQKPRAGSLRESYLQGVGVIKAITGQDRITIEEKGKPPTAGRLDLSVICASNHPPEFLTSGADASAWQRRMMIVEFPRMIPVGNRQEGLAEKIFEQEGPEIAAAAVAQFISAQQNGGYTIPLRSQQIMAELIAEAETLAERFISEQLTICAGRIDKKTLTERLFSWAESEGAKATPGDRNALYKELRARGCNESRGGGKKNIDPYFDGVKFSE